MNSPSKKLKKEGGWARCSEKDCEECIDSDTPESESRCRKCCSLEDLNEISKILKLRRNLSKCFSQNEEKTCEFPECLETIEKNESFCKKCINFSDIQCEKNGCDNYLTLEEVSNNNSECINCCGLFRCHNWPDCDFVWDGNAQHMCPLDE